MVRSPVDAFRPTRYDDGRSTLDRFAVATAPRGADTVAIAAQSDTTGRGVSR